MRASRPPSRGDRDKPFEDEQHSTLGASHGYSEIRSIGRGSFGVATLVRNKEGTLCVLKAVDMCDISQKQREESVLEASVLASLKHPYVVRYHEGFIEGESLAIVTEFASGGDLHQRIEEVRQRRETFSESQILRWLTHAALGLKYIHEHRIVHRDLKSQNLFLSTGGQLLIGDFGICKVLANDSPDVIVEERTVGTPLYLSPEVINRNEYSFASDMWALGCVLHELTMLRLPFAANSLPALAAKIMRGTMPQLPRQFSADLRQICADLLAMDPRRRQSSSELAQKPTLREEMSRMLQEECKKGNVPQLSYGPQKALRPAKLEPLSQAGYARNLPRISSAPFLPRPGESDGPTTPSGTLKRVGSAALMPVPVAPEITIAVERAVDAEARPATPSGTLQQVASAALLQRPPVPGHRMDSCSRAGSRPSSRATSVGSGPALSRASSFSSFAGSRPGSQSSSRPPSQAGSRAPSRSSPRGSAALPQFCPRPGQASSRAASREDSGNSPRGRAAPILGLPIPHARCGQNSSLSMFGRRQLAVG